MITDFEREVAENFISAKLGNRRDEFAEVDVHFVLPVQVYETHRALIEEITNGEFNVAAGYNLVLLYTNPEDSMRAGTALFGRDLDGLNGAWSNVLTEIAADPDKISRSQKFKAAHAYFRGATWHKPNSADPCASKNLLPRRSASPKKSIWKRLLN